MSIGYIVGFMFFYLALCLIFYSLCITASRADDIMEQEAREYWRTTIYLKGSDCDD